MSRVGEGEGERVGIQKATAELLAAVNSSDDRRLLALWSDDGVLMPPNHAVVRGRADLEEYFKERFYSGSPSPSRTSSWLETWRSSDWRIPP